MKTVIYCRKSTDREDMQQLSLASQIDEAKKIAEENWYQVVEVITESMTAKNPWRPEFARMMQMFHEWKAECIITWKLNRLARNPIDEWSIKWAIQNGIVKIIHTSDSIFKTWDNVLVMGMYFWMSTQYIIELKKDVERWMKKRVKSWEIITRVPLWYINNKITKSVDLDEEKAHYINRIFELRCKWKTLNQIKDIINEEGLRSYFWNKLWKSNIELILKNHFYYWAMSYAWELYKWNHEPIISKKVWDEANSFWKWITFQKNANNPIFALKWIVKHKESWKVLTASLAKKKYIYFHIHGESKLKERMWINQNIILDYFNRNIGMYSIPENLKEVILKWFKWFFDLKLNDVEKERKILNKKISDLKKKKKALLELRTSGELEKDEYMEEKNEIINNEIWLLNRLSDLSNQDNGILQKLSDTVELLTDLNSKRKTLDEANKLQFIKYIAVELNFDNKKRLYIKEKPLFEVIRNQNKKKWWVI